MLEPTLHLWNAQGIDIPRLNLAPRQAGLFFGRFKGLVTAGRTNSEIGRGGSGVIHLVRDTVLERDVALKLPHDSILAEPQAKREVQNEASQALELTHPNIVRIYDFHDQDNRWGISMQYVRGKNLDEWRAKLATHKVMGGAATDVAFYDVDRIRDWIRQLCSALSYVHEEANIAHCDIKPKNLLLERSIDTTTMEIQERLVITDFGITQKLRNHTSRVHTLRGAVRRTGEESDERGAAGTLAYMSPEQLIGNDGSRTDDIYAVGITIYELLTGRPPFFQGDPESIRLNIQKEVPPPMNRRRAERQIRAAREVPAAWEQAVAACLEKKAGDRPRSIAELAQRLGLSLEASIHGARPDSEIIQLQSTINEQQALIAEQQTTMDSLARRVSSSIEDNRQEIQRLTSERDAVISQYDALQQQVQALDQDRASLARQLAVIKEAGGSSASEAEIADLLKRSQVLAGERDVLSGRLQKAETELKKVQDSLRDAQMTLGETQQQLDRSERSEDKLKKERATALSAKSAAEAKAIELSRKTEQAQEELATTAKALRQAEARVEKTQEEVVSLRQHIGTVHDQQASPLKIVLIALTATMIVGALAGWGIGKMTAPVESTKNVEELLTSAERDSTGPVTNRDFKTYLSAVGLSTNKGFDNDDTSAQVSWLEAASFCEWLTAARALQKQGSDPNKWFDLPTYKELGATRAEGPEWTSDYADPVTGENPGAAHRKMKIYEKGGKAGSEYRDAGKAGFRFVLRGK